VEVWRLLLAWAASAAESVQMRQRHLPSVRYRRGGLLLSILLGGALVGLPLDRPAATAAQACPASVLNVIAAENQYGSLVRQLGGACVQVSSVMSDPSADPHEFETSVAVNRSYSSAQLVVENGLGYDDWSDRIIGTLSPKPAVVNAGRVLGLQVGDNPHVWYSPTYITRINAAITAALKQLSPRAADYFDAQAQQTEQALQPYYDEVAQIRARYSGTPVGATESIFVYLAEATGLNLISPPGFMNAISEGNSPSAPDVRTFQDQITQSQIKLLVYNQQTVSNLTSQLQTLAQSNRVPVVGVTETMVPQDSTFQAWQTAQLQSIQGALGGTSASAGR
jgi:zinc/manganese transport system substrate-binding protein